MTKRGKGPRRKSGPGSASGRPSGIEPQQFEQLLARLAASNFVFRLYVAGSNLHSVRAIENMRRLCREHLKGRCELYVIDLYQQPSLAARDHIVSVPSLVKVSPEPSMTFIGDLSNTETLLRSLGIVKPKTRVTKSAAEEDQDNRAGA